MKKHFIILYITSMIPLITLSQSKSEVGPFIGASYYLGDLNITKHFNQPKGAAGFLHRYVFNSHFSLKNSFYYGTVTADDAISKDPVQATRNLHFKSSILDIATVIEFNFFPFQQGKSEGISSRRGGYFATPYIFVGISMFSFNPQAEYKSKWYELQPLGTEGQGTIAYPERKKYSLTQLCIPFGGGFKYNVNKKVNIAFEWGFRYTFTDYIDDVSTTYANPMAISAEKGNIAKVLSDRSTDKETLYENTERQRGNSKSNDCYVFTGFILTFKITNKYKENKCVQQ
jgi:hypothetical protein